MSNKRGGKSQSDRAINLIKEQGKFHDPDSHGRPPPGLEYAPESSEPRQEKPHAKRKHGTQSQGHREGE